MKLSKASVALLLFQVLLVSSIGAKYLYQRVRCPRVWTRAAFYDPDLVMRGRYLSMTLTVNGCQSTLPSAKFAEFPRNIDGTTRPDGYSINAQRWTVFPADLKVEGNKLVAIRIQNPETPSAGEKVLALPEAPCDSLRLRAPVNFYIPEHTQTPVPLRAGQELWVEVTVPPKGPPRPIQLALKEDGGWRPLAFQ